MTTTDRAQLSVPARERYLELAVPLIAFGVTFAGILLWGVGLTIDFQYFSLGCLISSCILAYLAWIRPRKDIVALSTPIYGIVFLSTPIEPSAGAVLQLIYAAGLTILLIRLKRRFGTINSGSDILSPDEPLGKYRDQLIAELPPVTPSVALLAGRVFIRFAEGEYSQVQQLAAPVPEKTDPEASGILNRAFLVVAEQAGQMNTGSTVPDEFTRFSPEQQTLLFHPASKDLDRDREYSVMLDNALILLYAVAISNRESGTDMISTLDQLRPFARKLCGE